MPLITGPLLGDGVFLDIEVGWSHGMAKKARSAFRPVPPPLLIAAMIDTGAEITCIDSAIIQQLGLQFGGISLTNVPAQSGLSISTTNDVSLIIRHPSGDTGKHFQIGNLTILELNLSALTCQALIGRDVLTACRFLYDGQRNRFLLKYS
jgi:hypothetical protein